jgi:hypothetical protein
MDPRRLRATLTVAAAVVAVYAIVSLAARALLGRRHQIGDAIIERIADDTEVDPTTGAVRSVQSGDVVVPEEVLEGRWTPVYLERLARTYWRFLSRCTLGLVRVKYTERERFVVLLFRPLELLAFRAPEYEMDDTRGVVRWRIERGVLVDRRGRSGDGYLEIDVERRPSEGDGQGGWARVHVEVEIANFYPAIASAVGRWFYTVTQSRIHVLVCYGFLRSLARLDLAESKVGRFASIDDVPDPQEPPPSARSTALTSSPGSELQPDGAAA